MSLVDQYGKEVRANKPITDEIATVERDIFRDYMGNIQLNPDKVLRSEGGGKGIELYEDLLRDPKVGATLQTRRLAITGKEWEVHPADDNPQDNKVADYVSTVLKAINIDAARRAALSGLVLGFKAAEIMWEYSEGDIFINRIIPRASRRFTFGLDWQLRLLTLENMIEGEEIPDRKFSVFTNPSDNGSPYGDGLGRMLYWPVWFKKNGIKFWMIFGEKFGAPTTWGKYPPGTAKADRDKLLDACEAFQQESAIITPDNMSVELIEAARQGSINTYESLCQFMDKQIAQVMLGHTGSSESQAGKLGNDMEARDIREDYIKSDADLLCEAENNQIVRWICDYNFPSTSPRKGPYGNGYPKVWIKAETAIDLKVLADRDKIILVDMGMGKRVPETYIEETYGIPLAQADETTIDVPAPASPFGIGAGLAPARIAPTGIESGNRKGLPLQITNDPQKTNEMGVNMHECSCGRTHEFAADDPSQAWIQKYMDALAPSMASTRAAALTEIEAWLNTLQYKPAVEEFVAHIQDSLDMNFQGVDQKAIIDATAELYGFHRLTDILTGAQAAFGGADMRAVDFLSKLDNFYVSKFIQNPDAVATVKDFLNQQYLENGAGLFRAQSDESVAAFRDLFDQKLGDLQDYQIRRIADTAVQRTRNWAHTSQLQGAGITTLEVVEPTRDCAFCAQMDGKVISVANAYSRMQDQMDMTPEEYQAQFSEADNQPTIENIGNLVAAGALPPYHPHCRGRVISRTRS